MEYSTPWQSELPEYTLTQHQTLAALVDQSLVLPEIAARIGAETDDPYDRLALTQEIHTLVDDGLVTYDQETQGYELKLETPETQLAEMTPAVPAQTARRARKAKVQDNAAFLQSLGAELADLTTEDQAASREQTLQRIQEKLGIDPTTAGAILENLAKPSGPTAAEFAADLTSYIKGMLKEREVKGLHTSVIADEIMAQLDVPHHRAMIALSDLVRSKNLKSDGGGGREGSVLSIARKPRTRKT